MNSVYIAMSIDGYIATAGDPVSWLDEYNEVIASQPESYFAKRYASYYETVSTVVQGKTTYDVLQGFDIPYPYTDKPNYILTRHPQQSSESYLHFVTISEFLDLQLEGKTWIVGGGMIIKELLEQDAIDELIITVMPIVLGQGTRLFPRAQSMRQHYHLYQTYSEGDIVELTYRRVKDDSTEK